MLKLTLSLTNDLNRDRILLFIIASYGLIFICFLASRVDVFVFILPVLLKGEEHYNCISALHKSLRGSHENAALYWLGRMLEGGEDPLYVARRLVRFASEDVGM